MREWKDDWNYDILRSSGEVKEVAKEIKLILNWEKYWIVSSVWSSLKWNTIDWTVKKVLSIIKCEDLGKINNSSEYNPYRTIKKLLLLSSNIEALIFIWTLESGIVDVCEAYNYCSWENIDTYNLKNVLWYKILDMSKINQELLEKQIKNEVEKEKEFMDMDEIDI